MIPAGEEPRELTTYLDRLRELPFVRGVKLTPLKLGPYDPNAALILKTPRRGFKLGVEVKRTFLDRALTNALIAQHTALQRRHGLPLFLAARYIPRPTGERLAQAGVNFVDRAGNIHLKLGDAYQVLLLGRKERLSEPAARRPGPAFTQFLFTLLAQPEAIAWPIRKIADAAGIGKTMAAIGRQRLVRQGLIRPRTDGGYLVTDHKRLGEDFMIGYSQVLRPNLLIGTYRALERDPELLLRKLAASAKRSRVDWAVTGGPAAYTLERFYRGEDVPLFIRRLSSELQRELKLVPDAHGPVVVLRAFGNLLAWRNVDDLVLADPWLIYAELLESGEPRALEAADQIREKYLLQ